MVTGNRMTRSQPPTPPPPPPPSQLGYATPGSAYQPPFFSWRLAVPFWVFLVAATLFMWLVVPKFEQIFKDFKTTLPALTEYLLKTSTWIAEDFGWLVILGSPFAVFFTIKIVGKSKAGRRMIDRIKLKLPIIGQIISKTSIARFTRTLGTLLSAGVPILDALNITRDTVGNTGETGLAGGDHLHFSTMVRGIHVDPVEWWDGHWMHDHVEARLAAYPRAAATAPAP